MLKKRLAPPYVPILKNDADTAHFDLEEVKDNMDLTLEDTQSNRVEPTIDYDGFTFDGGNSTILGSSLETASHLR